MTAHPLAGSAFPESAPVGKCRMCGDESWRVDQLDPVHPCCVIHARENQDGRAWRARHRARPAGGADATPLLSVKRGLAAPPPCRWALAGPWGAAAAGLPLRRSARPPPQVPGFLHYEEPHFAALCLLRPLFGPGGPAGAGSGAAVHRPGPPPSGEWHQGEGVSASRHAAHPRCLAHRNYRWPQDRLPAFVAACRVPLR